MYKIIILFLGCCLYNYTQIYFNTQRIWSCSLVKVSWEIMASHLVSANPSCVVYGRLVELVSFRKTHVSCLHLILRQISPECFTGIVTESLACTEWGSHVYWTRFAVSSTAPASCTHSSDIDIWWGSLQFCKFSQMCAM